MLLLSNRHEQQSDFLAQEININVESECNNGQTTVNMPLMLILGRRP